MFYLQTIRIDYETKEVRHRESKTSNIKEVMDEEVTVDHLEWEVVVRWDVES